MLVLVGVGGTSVGVGGTSVAVGGTAVGLSVSTGAACSVCIWLICSSTDILVSVACAKSSACVSSMPDGVAGGLGKQANRSALPKIKVIRI